jgi:predicted PurR-regulated permease PerM
VPDHTTTDNSTGAFAKRLLLTFIVLSLALLLWHAAYMFLLIFAAIIFGVFLNKTGEMISSRTGISIRWGISIVLLFLLVIITAATLFVAPQIAEQVENLYEKMPNSWEQLRSSLSDTRLGSWLSERIPSLKDLIGSLGGLMRKATSWIYSGFGALFSFLIVLVIGIYLAYDADLFILGIVKLVSKDKRSRARRTLHGVGVTLYWWLIGRFCSMAIIAIFTVIGLWLIGMPMALTLGLFAGVMTFIPNLGPIISVIPAILLALQDGWAQVGYVAALYAGIQVIESYVITPIIQRQVIAMPPALILCGQIVMGVLQGILGVLLATPLVAVTIVLVKLLYIEDVLGDHEVQIEAESTEDRDHRAAE